MKLSTGIFLLAALCCMASCSNNDQVLNTTLAQLDNNSRYIHERIYASHKLLYYKQTERPDELKPFLEKAISIQKITEKFYDHCDSLIRHPETKKGLAELYNSYKTGITTIAGLFKGSGEENINPRELKESELTNAYLPYLLKNEMMLVEDRFLSFLLRNISSPCCGYTPMDITIGNGRDTILPAGKPISIPIHSNIGYVLNYPLVDITRVACNGRRLRVWPDIVPDRQSANIVFDSLVPGKYTIQGYRADRTPMSSPSRFTYSFEVK